MKKFYILCRETCSRCNGIGSITHPFWIEYLQKEQKALQENPNLNLDDFCDDFWISKGLEISKILPEEIECPSCNGKGIIEYKYPFLTALKQILKEEELSL